jgi:lactonase family protein with 7-bladed beta-propeller
VLLYAASYAGAIFTLNLTKSAASGYILETQQAHDGCRPSPSWLTLDFPNSVLYCTDEGLSSDHGSVSAFDVSEDGFLSLNDRVNVISGPVSAVAYGHHGLSLAVAQ